MANTRRRHYRSYLLHLLPLACSAQKKICWAALATASRHDVPIGGPDSLDAGFGRKVPDSPALPAAQPQLSPADRAPAVFPEAPAVRAIIHGPPSVCHAATRSAATRREFPTVIGPLAESRLHGPRVQDIAKRGDSRD